MILVVKKISVKKSNPAKEAKMTAIDDTNGLSEKHNDPKTSGLGLMSLNDNKAGMKGLDKEKINAIIENASKGSKFYAKQQENQARIDVQIENLKLRFASISNKEILVATQE